MSGSKRARAEITLADEQHQLTKKARIDPSSKTAADAPVKVRKPSGRRVTAKPTKRLKTTKSKATGKIKSAEFVTSDVESSNEPLGRGKAAAAAGPSTEGAAGDMSGRHEGASTPEELTKNLVPLTAGGLSVSAI